MSLDGTLGITLPAAAAPAFSAYQSSAQTLSSATFTKIQFQTKEFDTNSNFDNTTNYRFTPTVAGYYQITAAISISTSATPILVQIYKNGSNFKTVCNLNTATTSTGAGSALVYANGTTDYFEIYGYVGTGQALSAAFTSTYFQASMARSA
jgi:hypothetical protein